MDATKQPHQRMRFAVIRDRENSRHILDECQIANARFYSGRFLETRIALLATLENGFS